MEKINISIKNLYFILLIAFVSCNLRKDLTKFNISNKVIRNLENKNYIIIYFNQNCSYPSGFGNIYRNNIDFIVNEEDKDHIYTYNEELTIKKDFGIEIHFNKIINSLQYFFDRDFDENIK